MRRVLHALALLSVLILPSVLFGASPGDVSDNLQLWLKADSESAGTVSTWHDKSINGWDATQSDNSKKPTNTDNIANFNPAVRFDGADDFMDVNYHSELNGKNLTVFIVTKYSGGNSGDFTPWCTRNESSFFGTTRQGHLLRIHDRGYEYWTGTGGGFGSDGEWKKLTGGTVDDNYQIFTTKSTQKNGGKVKKWIYLQGKNLDNHTDAFSANAQNPFRIGAGKTEDNDGGFFWPGDIAEVVVYDDTLANNDRKKVESYLAIKYGITLTQKKNYFNSDGDTIWKGPSEYRNDVAGLGRDDKSGLDQKISKSINADAIVTMATTSDFTSANAGRATSLSTDDKRFLIWSNDDGGATWTETGAPAGGKILVRKWHAEKTGGNEHNVSIQVDVDDPEFNIENFSGDLYFVQGNDLSKAKPQKMTDDGSGKWHIDNITFNDTNSKNNFSFVIPKAVPASAHMVINEILYRQKTSNSHANEEFIEFYVTQAGTLDGLLFDDQDGGGNHQYLFGDVHVEQGDYIVLYIGDGTNTTGDTGSNVHKFYMDRTEILNNGGDDIVLMQRSATDVSKLDGAYIFYVPVDYVSYGSGNAIDPIPETTQNPTISWDANITVPSNMPKLKSISLTNNGEDHDHASDWEVTTSGTALGLMTIDHNNDSVGGTPFICSDGYNNNAMPDMHITKTSIVISDPVNTTNNPKRIPGAVVRYCFTVDNTGDGDADNATIHDSLTGDGRDNLEYKASGSTPAGNIATACDCANITNTNGTISGTDVTIDLGDINGTGDTAHSRACAYIKVEIK